MMVKATADVLAMAGASVCWGLVVLAGKRDSVSTAVREWLVRAAEIQAQNMCLLFRVSLALLGSGLMMSVVADNAGFSEDWPKLIGLFGFCGIIGSAMYQRARESFCRCHAARAVRSAEVESPKLYVREVSSC